MKTLKNSIKVLFFLAACLLTANATATYFDWSINPVALTALVAVASLAVTALRPNGVAFEIIDMSGVAWNGDEVRSMSQAIFEKVFSKPAFTTLHRIETGIKAKKQIVFLGKLGLVGKKHVNGTCQPDASTEQITSSDKFWEPAYIEDLFSQCWDDLQEEFWIWGLKNGVEKADLTATDFSNFLEDRLGDAMMEAVYRIAWFGDTAANNVYASGNLTDGVEPDFFTPIDGLWKQIFAVVSGDSTRRGLVAQNAGGTTYVTQAFNATDTTNKVATTVFDNLLYNADFRLREQPNLVIIATQSLVDQYARERKAASGIDLAYTRQESGIKTFEVNGIPVIPFTLWDRYIRAYEDNGTLYRYPHRALLTTIDNIPIGTEEAGNLFTMKPWYSLDTNKYNVKFGFNLDAKVLEGYMIQVAYGQS